MRPFFGSATFLVFLELISITKAHGYISEIVIGDKTYGGDNPRWLFDKKDSSDRAVWYAFNQDAGPINSTGFSNNAIICHRGATPGGISIPVTAGSEMILKWLRWPQEHPGPVLNYMAKCTASCTEAVPTDLAFFKISEDGLYNGTAPEDGVRGEWATNQLYDENNSWRIVIPSNIESGHYVLRNELMPLHLAWFLGGAQSFPTCINLEVTGSGDVEPCAAGADCRKGTELYNMDDPGLLLDIFHGVSSYEIPGPKIWSGLTVPRTYKNKIFPEEKKAMLFGQCGGARFWGPTKCPEGTTCQYRNKWYSHCAP